VTDGRDQLRPVGMGKVEDCYVAVLQLIGLRVEKIKPPAGAKPHPGAIGLHAPLPFLCLMTSFQSFCPPGGTMRFERTHAASAIAIRCTA